MESSEIKVISHKENLICYKISITAGSMPVLNADVFDMCFSDDILTIWLEHKFEEKLLSELSINKLKYTKNDERYAIINILGYRICKDFQFFSGLYDLLSKICSNPFTIQNNGIGVQIAVKQEEVAEVIQHLHNEYIIGENL